MKDHHFESNWDATNFALLLAALGAFADQLPDAPTLTSAERKANQGIAEGRLYYALKALAYAKDYPEEINIKQKDLDQIVLLGSDFERLSELKRQLEIEYTKVCDAHAVVGGQFFEASGLVHDSIELAVKRGEGGLRAALAELDKMYAAQGNRKPRNGGDEDTSSGDDAPTDTPV